MGCEPSSRHPAGNGQLAGQLWSGCACRVVCGGAALADRRETRQVEDRIAVRLYLSGRTERRRRIPSPAAIQGNLPAVRFRAGGHCG